MVGGFEGREWELKLLRGLEEKEELAKERSRNQKGLFLAVVVEFDLQRENSLVAEAVLQRENFLEAEADLRKEMFLVVEVDLRRVRYPAVEADLQRVRSLVAEVVLRRERSAEALAQKQMMFDSGVDLQREMFLVAEVVLQRENFLVVEAGLQKEMSLVAEVGQRLVEVEPQRVSFLGVDWFQKDYFLLLAGFVLRRENSWPLCLFARRDWYLLHRNLGDWSKVHSYSEAWRTRESQLECLDFAG